MCADFYFLSVIGIGCCVLYWIFKISSSFCVKYSLENLILLVFEGENLRYYTFIYILLVNGNKNNSIIIGCIDYWDNYCPEKIVTMTGLLTNTEEM